MTSNFKTRYGQTFDNIFIAGEGTQTFGLIDSDGVDVGQKYLPASDGDPQDACGFLDSTGADIGPKLCKPGTNWTHAVTLAGHSGSSMSYRDFSVQAITKCVPFQQYPDPSGYFNTLEGAIVAREGEAAVVQIASVGIDNKGMGDGGYEVAMTDYLAIDGITEGETWNVTRLDTKTTWQIHAYLYTSLVLRNPSLGDSFNKRGCIQYADLDKGPFTLFTVSDIGKTLYLKIKKA